MSTDTLFRSIPTTSLNDAQNINKNTVDPAATKTTPLNPAPVATPSVLTPSVEMNNTSLFSNAKLPPKKDISRIPPVFFAGPKPKEEVVVLEPQSSTDSGSSVSFADRRLSGILAETIDKHEEEKKEEFSVPVKRAALGVADPNRGIFGNKSLKVHANDNIHNETPDSIPSATTSKPSRTIRVFGYPPNLIHNVIQHFMTYGKIENYQTSPGNWITITFENSSMALAALKSNGVVISKIYLIGVSLEKEETQPAVAKNVIPMDVSNGVFKEVNNVNSSLGSGKVGVSAEVKNNAATGGFMSRLKDTFLGW